MRTAQKGAGAMACRWGPEETGYELTQGEQNLILLQKSLPAGERLYLWCYSVRSGELFASTCPEAKVLHRVFCALGGLERALEYAGRPGRKKPLLIGSAIGLQWAATLESERDRGLLFLLGPVLLQPYLEIEMRQGLRSLCLPEEEWQGALLGLAPELPVMPYEVFCRYALLLHNVLNDDRLGMEALWEEEAPSPAGRDSLPGQDQSRIYLAERALLQMVRDGDIGYQTVLESSALPGDGVPVQGRDPLRAAKTSMAVFTGLVCRAAMEGGLPPETAYPLSGFYLQAAEDCRDPGQLATLKRAMYHDFIYRVHRQCSNPGYSHAVQKCCDYIQLNLDKKVTAGQLAALVGYSEYYLTEKFREETGVSLSYYVRCAKAERAKTLLAATRLTVGEIAAQLAFATPSFFIRCFREIAGCTPAQYRKGREHREAPSPEQ